MISRGLALRLREAGLTWQPSAGDRFQFAREDMESTGTDAFTVSDMTIEAHHYPSGTVLGFNGTTEWALDSVSVADAVWLPREDQLRSALRGTFERLERDGDAWAVTTRFRNEVATFTAASADDAYGNALLAQVLAARA